MQHHTAFIKKMSASLGFDYCGIARAVRLEADANRLERWLQKGMHGKMQYMENYFDMRIDPTLLVPGAKSVITVLKNYYPSQQQESGTPGIAKYAFGKDYHDVMRDHLNELLLLVKENIGEINGRGFVDSAPVLERTWNEVDSVGWVRTVT